jgi:copper chaperone CopZ
MLRRRFIQLMTVAGAGGLATLNTLEAGDARTVAYSVKGFTCMTCAVGLETLLRQEKGVLSAKASYLDASAVIRYQPAMITEEQLKRFIADMGFTAEPKHQS